MTARTVERLALVAAGLVIGGLTVAAFWLSYAHLQSVAATSGLADSPARSWAWPATLDAFILGGELLMLRAGLRHHTDWWAIGLTATGSVGSIALNIAGVGTGQPLLNYVVAAVPPAAALLAFGVLMRQVHGLVADPAPVAPPVRDTEGDTALSPVVAEVSPTPRPTLLPATASPQVICGGHLEIPAVPPRPKLTTEEARSAMEQAWRTGLSLREAARVSTRSPSQVQRVYTRLEAQHGGQPMPGQIALDGAAA